MKIKTLLYLLCWGLLAFSLGCNSGKKAFERGDVEVALNQAIGRLKSAPSHKKATQTLQVAYPYFLEVYQEKIDREMLRDEALKWEPILAYYGTMNRVYESILNTPAARAVVTPRSFYPEYESAKSQLVETYYDLGRDFLAKDTRADAVEAYLYFSKAYELRPDYRDVKAQLDRAQSLATLVVYVAPIELPTKRYELSKGFFEQQVLTYLREQTGNPLVAFMGGEGSASRISPDHKVELAFDDFSVGNFRERETQADRLRDSVVVGTAKVGDSVVNTYGTVKARVYCFQKEVSSTGLLDMKIKDTRTGQVIAQQKFPGTFVWYDYWGYFEGDRRALAEEDEKFIRKRRPAPEPLPQDLFVAFTEPIYDQLTRYLNDFYRDY